MNVRRALLTVAWCVAFAATVWAQGLIICRACGREAKAGETVCSHCATTLPKPRSDAPQEQKPQAPAVDPAAEVVRAATVAVANSLRQARELEKTQPEVALSYYQNALALMRLTPAGSLPTGIGEAILNGNGTVLQMLLRGQIACRKCNGTGKYQMDLGKVDHKKNVKAVEGVSCPACKGRGTFAGFRDVSKVKMAILQGRSEFERRQMVAGDIRVGRALMPDALNKLMTDRQRSLVMTGMQVPCSDCQLTGRQKCTTCKATGWVKCPEPDCNNGVYEEARSTGTRTEKRIGEELTRKCSRCDGLGEAPCTQCKGCGSVVCSKCDGSGTAPRCSRCTGTGLMACSKCKGTGEVKGGACPECKGETVRLCATCRGEGAVSR